MVTNLDLLGIKPQIWVGALQRPLPERLDLLIQRPAQRAHPVLGHPVDPQLLHEPVDLPGRDAVHVRLQHDRDDRLLRTPPRLQKAREIRRAPTLLRDQQHDLTDPGLPRPRAIPVAMRRPDVGRDLTELRADLRRDLALHQLAGDQRHRLTHEILKPTVAHLRDDIANRHALTFGHRGVLLHVDCEQPTSSAPRWPTLFSGRPTRRPSHHFYRHDPTPVDWLLLIAQREPSEETPPDDPFRRDAIAQRRPQRRLLFLSRRRAARERIGDSSIATDPRSPRSGRGGGPDRHCVGRSKIPHLAIGAPLPATGESPAPAGSTTNRHPPPATDR